MSAPLHGYIFPVKDGGKTRMAVIYAGTILTPDIISDQGSETRAIGVPRRRCRLYRSEHRPPKTAAAL